MENKGLNIYFFCPCEILNGKIARRQADVSMEVHPTAIQLFRYSALTFNSHRIHFDHEYANNVEDHPGKSTNVFPDRCIISFFFFFFVMCHQIAHTTL